MEGRIQTLHDLSSEDEHSHRPSCAHCTSRTGATCALKTTDFPAVMAGQEDCIVCTLCPGLGSAQDCYLSGCTANSGLPETKCTCPHKTGVAFCPQKLLGENKIKIEVDRPLMQK